MVSATKSSKFVKGPTEYIAISAMTSSEKSKLKKKLKLQLQQVRSAIKDIDNYVPKKTMRSPTSVLQFSPTSVLPSSPGKALSAAIRKARLHFREKDRAAARIALQQMKKTVYIYEDAETVNEIERVGNLQIFGPDDNPLEMLGLYLKKDYMEEEEEEEEGELKHLNGGYWDLEEGFIAQYLKLPAAGFRLMPFLMLLLLDLLQLGSIISPLLMLLLLHLLLLLQMPFFLNLFELVGMAEIKAKSEGECTSDVYVFGGCYNV